MGSESAGWPARRPPRGTTISPGAAPPQSARRWLPTGCWLGWRRPACRRHREWPCATARWRRRRSHRGGWRPCRASSDGEQPPPWRRDPWLLAPGNKATPRPHWPVRRWFHCLCAVGAEHHDVQCRQPRQLRAGAGQEPTCLRARSMRWRRHWSGAARPAGTLRRPAPAAIAVGWEGPGRGRAKASVALPSAAAWPAAWPHWAGAPTAAPARA
mmetsp:Transcript_58568/g.188227  ORF Transcript_58568/g.188227 Transcript_58568/m.188227 type:complete len:213 (+) Transcript_58568:650-1288(+)